MRIASFAVKQSEHPARMVDSGESPDKMGRRMIAIVNLNDDTVKTGELRHERDS